MEARSLPGRLKRFKLHFSGKSFEGFECNQDILLRLEMCRARYPDRLQYCGRVKSVRPF